MVEDRIMAELVTALTADVVGGAQSPYPATTAFLLVRGTPLITERVSSALGILKSCLRSVRRRVKEGEAEDLDAMLSRYLRAAQEGAAKRNLHLMAQVIAGMASQEAVDADAFLRHANMLADLSQDEAILLASILKETESDGKPRNVGRDALAAGQPLIRKVFKDNRQLVEACAALVRTGYVMPLSGPDGHMAYRTTASYERLVELVDLADQDLGDNY